MPVPAPPGTAPPGAYVSPHAVVVAYTPQEYAPIIAAAIAQAVHGGCGCAAASTVVTVQEQCPCVQQQLAAMKAKGKAIKQVLSQVVKAAAQDVAKKAR
jgi:hypothetical protein